jgi:hypothetical protein
MRLVTFGCSYTYGEGITEKDLRPHMTIPSKYSWASILANMLNCEVINLAVPASSNKHILYQLTNFNFELDDVVCVQFAYFTRDTLYSENEFIHLNPGGKEHSDKIKLYYQLYDDYNLFLNNVLVINSCYDLLQNKNVKYVCRFAGYNNNITNINSIKYNHQFILDKQKHSFRDIGDTVNINDRYGADQKHYSKEVHRLIAAEYFNEVRKLL